jgi:hypothetical protein
MRPRPVLCGLALVDLYALGTRLLPDRLGSAGDLATNRLAAPIGYWNALGLASVMALVVGLGLAIRARSVLARSAAALALPVSASTLYFTFSRGSWIVLVIALLVLVALDARRLHLVTASGIVALPAAVAVLLSWHTRSLNRVGGGAPAALHDGHRLALLVALLALVSAAVATAAALIEPHITVGAALRRAYGCVLAALAVAAIAIGFAVAGGPAKVIRHGWHSFTAPPGQIDVGQQQSKRLFSLSNNNRIELWRAAWEEAKAHPLAGGGAGSFEQWWLAHRKSTQQVRDAHSLYLQTLGETGVVGLALLGLALLVPLAAALRGRRRPLVPFAAAAYVAYLVHVAGDWDWQLAGVTLPALALGAATVVMGRELGHEPQRERVRWAAVAAAGAAIFVSFLMVLGNVPLTRASNAADRAQWRDSARDARTAQRWLPWASEPDRLIGEAALARRDRPTARRALEAALGRDRENWQLWFDLSAATRGRASNRALAQAKALNPLSPEIAQLIEVGR